LKESVYHAPDPQALPSMNDVERRLQDVGQETVERLLAG
jgi:hypothetical protein